MQAALTGREGFALPASGRARKEPHTDISGLDVTDGGPAGGIMSGMSAELLPSLHSDGFRVFSRAHSAVWDKLLHPELLLRVCPSPSKHILLDPDFLTCGVYITPA